MCFYSSLSLQHRVPAGHVETPSRLERCIAAIRLSLALKPRTKIPSATAGSRALSTQLRKKGSETAGTRRAAARRVQDARATRRSVFVPSTFVNRLNWVNARQQASSEVAAACAIMSASAAALDAAVSASAALAATARARARPRVSGRKRSRTGSADSSAGSSRFGTSQPPPAARARARARSGTFVNAGAAGAATEPDACVLSLVEVADPLPALPHAPSATRGEFSTILQLVHSSHYLQQLCERSALSSKLKAGVPMPPLDDEEGARAVREDRARSPERVARSPSPTLGGRARTRKRARAEEERQEREDAEAIAAAGLALSAKRARGAASAPAPIAPIAPHATNATPQPQPQPHPQPSVPLHVRCSFLLFAIFFCLLIYSFVALFFCC